MITILVQCFSFISLGSRYFRLFHILSTTSSCTTTWPQVCGKHSLAFLHCLSKFGALHLADDGTSPFFIPSGYLTQPWYRWPIEQMVYLLRMVIFHGYVKQPDGRSINYGRCFQQLCVKNCQRLCQKSLKKPPFFLCREGDDKASNFGVGQYLQTNLAHMSSAGE